MMTLYQEWVMMSRFAQGVLDDTFPLKFEASYDRLVQARADNSQMPELLSTSLVVTAANARYLYEQSQNEPSLLPGALFLMDQANQLLTDWERDPDTWLRAPDET